MAHLLTGAHQDGVLHHQVDGGPGLQDHYHPKNGGHLHLVAGALCLQRNGHQYRKKDGTQEGPLYRMGGVHPHQEDGAHCLHVDGVQEGLSHLTGYQEDPQHQAGVVILMIGCIHQTTWDPRTQDTGDHVTLMT